MLNNMKIEELKNFLRLRGLKVTGEKEILVASAFCAIENNVTLVRTAQEVQAQLKEEYSKKLELEDCTSPDPFKLKTCWMEEEDGIAHWSIIPVICILNFLMINSDIRDLSD